MRQPRFELMSTGLQEFSTLVSNGTLNFEFQLKMIFHLKFFEQSFQKKQKRTLKIPTNIRKNAPV